MPRPERASRRTEANRRTQAKLLIPLLAAAAALLVTIPGLSGGFVWDDRWLILQSPLRAHPGLLGRVVLGGHGWGTFLTPEQGTAYFRPLGNLLHGLLLITVGGTPFPFHLASALLHAGTAFLLGILLYRQSPRAAWAAVAFAVHPVLADAHAWISAAPDLLAALLLLAVLLALDRPRPRLWLVGLLWFLALAAKESAAVGVFWVPLFLLWRNKALTPAVAHGPPTGAGRGWTAGLLSGARRPLLAFIPATAAYIILRAFGPGFHPVPGERPPGVDAAGIVLVGRVFLLDLWRLLVPMQITLSPPSWVVTGGNEWTGYAGALLGLAVLTWSLWAVRRRGPAERSGPVPALAWGFLYCAAALLPVLQILPTGDVYGGRFLVLPAAGLALGIGGALAALPPLPRSWSRAGAAAGLLLLALGAWHAGQRAAEWRDEGRLFGTEYRRLPNGIRSGPNWASYLLNNGRKDEARPVIARLFQRLPQAPGIRSLQAGLYLSDGNLVQAEAMFRELCRTEPHTPPLLANLASCQIRLGKLNEGLATLDEAAGLAALTPGMRNNRGLALEQLGRTEEALQEYERAVREDPGYEAARVNLLRLLVRTSRDPSEARRQGEEFLRLFPGSPHTGTVRALLGTLSARGM